MDANFAMELYSEALLELSRVGSEGLDADKCQDNNAFLSDVFYGDSDEPSGGDRESKWGPCKWTHDQFHTLGYRRGLIEGKEASVQEGFNIGFKKSVLVGFNWGVVRGVTSALACLPDELKEKLIQTQETKNKFWELNKSIHSLSTSDALKLYHEDITIKQDMQQSDGAKCGNMESYVGKLQSLLLEYPTVKVQLATE